MLLYGLIGDGDKLINGHYFAREFRWVDENHDEIEMRINCDGGSMSHGLSIITEMQAAKSQVTTVASGVVASMAVPILLSGDVVKCYDYAKIMIHSPYYADENGDAVKKLSAKDRKALNMFKDTLKRLLMQRGLPEADAMDMMKTDTWLTPEEAKEKGIVDEIVKSGRKKELAALAPIQLVAQMNAENSKLNNSNVKMKEVIAKLGLAENSDEQAVVAAIETLQNKPPKVEKPSEAVVAKLIVVGKKVGIVTDKNEAAMKELAETNLELFVNLIDEEKLAKPATGGDDVRLSEVLAKLGESGKGTETEKDWDWYQKNDPQALAKMETAEPEKYKKLFDAYWGK